MGAPHSKDGSINTPRAPDTSRETWNLWPPALGSQCAVKLTWEVEELKYGIPTLAGHPLGYEPGQVTALWAFASRMTHGHLEIDLSEQTITPANPAPEPPFPSRALLSAPRPQPATSPRAPGRQPRMLTLLTLHTSLLCHQVLWLYVLHISLSRAPWSESSPHLSTPFTVFAQSFLSHTCVQSVGRVATLQKQIWPMPVTALLKT